MCFKPNTRALRLAHLNLYVMRHVGVRALFLDADNTVAPWNTADVPDDALAWIRAAQAAGFAVLVASNSGAERLAPLRDRLGVNCFGRMGKPLPFRLRRLARSLGLKPAQCAMVGDQLLTDVLAGNLAGMHTVLLDPLDPSREFRGTLLNRRIERIVKKLWKIQ